jgi:outer membrane protein OmpA-like peptidoglycan-associated protein
VVSVSKLSKHAVFTLVAAAAALAGCSQMSGLETRARILAEPPCTDFFFPIYFADRSSDLSKSAQGVIDNAGKHAQGCTVTQVQVTGLADFQGTQADNLDLSRRRARNVAQALAKVGLPRPAFQLDALGDAGATAGGTPVPLRRRADVYIRFQRER